MRPGSHSAARRSEPAARKLLPAVPVCLSHKAPTHWGDEQWLVVHSKREDVIGGWRKLHNAKKLHHQVDDETALECDMCDT
jgi:hypothetical protein